MDADPLVSAITAYFRGERHEMVAILAGSLGLVVAASGLHAVARDGFSRAFGVASLVVAVALSSTAASLLRRDPPHQARLVASLAGPDARAAVAGEAARMDAVIGKYPIYRYAAVGLALAALLAAAIRRTGGVAGAAAGVLLLAVAQLAIDHYSEARATRYAAELRASLAARP